MRIALGFVMLLPLFAQDPPVPQARELIEQLHSEKIRDRNEAARRLKELGPAVLPELQSAAKDKDPEVAARATFLIRVIEIKAKLTPNLLKLMPGIEDRLATAEPSAWTELFLRVSSQIEETRFGREDLGPLAAMAVRGARNTEERVAVCKHVANRRLRSARTELIPLLSDPEGEVRCYAARAIGEIRALEAAPEILKLLLRTPAHFYSVRESAIRTLGLLGAKQAAPAIAKLLTEHPLDWRGEAALALGRLGALEAAPEIAKLCDPRDPPLSDSERQDVVHALGQLGAKETVPQIVKLLKDKNVEVRGEAVRVLGRLGARQAAPEILSLVEDSDADVSGEAVRVLEELGSTDVVPELLKLLRSDRTPVRVAALKILATSKAKEAVPEIAKLLADETWEVRGEAALALGGLGAKESIPEIAKLLEDREGDVCKDAIRSLTTLGARQSAPRILKLLEEVDVFVRKEAVSALGQFRATELIPEIAPLLQHKEDRVRENALEALVELGAKEALPELVKLAKGRKTGFTAVFLLQRIDPRQSVPVVLKLLKDPEFSLDIFVEEVLAEARTKEEVVPDLLELLKSDKSTRRYLAIRVLADVGAREALPEIRTLAKDDLPGVREAVEFALRTLEERPAKAADSARAEDLLDQLYDSSSVERVKAAKSLCRVGRTDGVALLLGERHEGLAVLNQLARPELWQRFDASVLKEDFRGTRKEILERIGREEGVNLLLRSEERSLDRMLTVFSGQHFGEVLEAALEGTDCEAVWDGEGIRIVPRKEAEKRWRDWFKIEGERFESKGGRFK